MFHPSPSDKNCFCCYFFSSSTPPSSFILDRFWEDFSNWEIIVKVMVEKQIQFWWCTSHLNNPLLFIFQRSWLLLTRMEMKWCSFLCRKNLIKSNLSCGPLSLYYVGFFSCKLFLVLNSVRIRVRNSRPQISVRCPYWIISRHPGHP